MPEDGSGTDGAQRPEAATDWVAARRPAPPEELMELLTPCLEAREATEKDLGEAARHALERTLGAPVRERTTADHVLVADALLTYACEAAVGTPDCGAAFEELLRRAGARSRAEGPKP